MNIRLVKEREREEGRDGIKKQKEWQRCIT